MGDGDVFESNVEFLRTLKEVGTDTVGDGLSLGDELCGIELGNNRFKNFVSDGWENSLVVILSEILVDD